MNMITFGARVTQVIPLRGNNVQILIMPTKKEREAYQFDLVDYKVGEPTTLTGGADCDFQRSFWGSSAGKPNTPALLLKAAKLITDLKFAPGVLDKSGLTEEGVKHRLLKGLARILCSDAVGFQQGIQGMFTRGKNELTL